MLGCGPNCSCQNHSQMGQFELIPGIISGILGIGQAAQQVSLAKQQIKAQKQIAQQQQSSVKAQQALEIAQTQYQGQLQAQQVAVTNAQSMRNQEVIALVAIGGAAFLISALFLWGAMKKKG